MDKKPYGLVLTGGGGKGAYQIGAIKALHTLGMDQWIVSVSGSSAGALNSILFLNNDLNEAEYVWTTIRPIQFLDIEPEGYCSRDGLIKLMNDVIDLQQISKHPIPTYISVADAGEIGTNAPTRINTGIASIKERGHCTGDYLLLNGREPKQILDILLAATAIPVVYDPVQIDGIYYRDGGLFDNVPLRPLLETGSKDLIVIKCSPNQKCNPNLVAQLDSILEIAPSSNIGSLLSGTFDFDGRNASFRLQLGYYDTLREIEYFDRTKLGLPPTEEEKKQRIAQDYERALSASKISTHVESANRNKSKIDSILKKYGL